MNVTILVGNGFDLNLNLKTKYTDFIENYCGDTGGDSKDIKSFKDDIIKDCETWANAELAFGMYTINFLGSEDGAEKFCNCHDDFCENLAQYLQSQEKLLNWKFEPTSIARTFGGCISFANLVSGLLETEKMKFMKPRHIMEERLHIISLTLTIQRRLINSLKWHRMHLELSEKEQQQMDDSTTLLENYTMCMALRKMIWYWA